MNCQYLENGVVFFFQCFVMIGNEFQNTELVSHYSSLSSMSKKRLCIRGHPTQMQYFRYQKPCQCTQVDYGC